MNQSFINIYSQLNNKTIKTTGLWIAQGDEPLMSQWLVDSLRPIWTSNRQNIQRIELSSSKTWQEVLSQLDSLSLFDPANAIIVTGNHKPDKSTIAELSNIACRIQNEQEQDYSSIQNHLLWITNKQDKRSLSSKWIQPFKQGLIIDCNLYNEQQRQEILLIHAHSFGLNLSNDSWKLLISHTQNNLLDAYQCLWRLSYLFSVDQSQEESIDTFQQAVDIDTDKLQSALVSQSSYSVFDLSDAMLAGNSQQVIKIIETLKSTHEPTTLVLWIISKDMRLIQQLQSGKDPKSIGIWSSKQGLYQNAAHRLSNEETKKWAHMLFQCDQAIKGVIKQNSWELLLQVSLLVTGIQLFSI